MGPRPRNVVILGSTGSIGRQAIDVIQRHADRLRVVGLVAGQDRDALNGQASMLGVTRAALGGDAAADMARLDEADVVLNAIVGAAGLRASVAALESGKTLALANKESLVAGGEACFSAARRGGGQIVAVDSEHAALAQCLQGRDRASVDRIVLTASGGPFRTRPDLGSVTPAEALRHPTWSMGPKITIDSATMMNKGLELIEAHFLFDFPLDRIDVLVHPQSTMHAIVELVDGSMLMQAAPADMRIPIQAALTWPERLHGGYGRVDLISSGPLEFEQVDDARFPAVGLARRAGLEGRSYPAVLNAANEAAVKAFLEGRLAFVDIPRVVEKVLGAHAAVDAGEVEAVIEVDDWARREATRVMLEKAPA